MGKSGMALVRGFGIGVRRLREARGWSQEELAEHADLNRSFIGEIERGTATPSLVTVAKLSQAFKLSPSALVRHGEVLIAAKNVRAQLLMAIDG
jgi:transcriptional regulator with XRE-family HTH domain